MSSEFGLSIGESFAELVGMHGASAERGVQEKVAATAPFHARWYLPKKNLADGLRESLKAAEAVGLSPRGQLRVASQSVERTLNKGQGRAPALLVTNGLESWLRVKQPFASPQFALTPKRRELLVEEDFVFGVGGRLTADGTEQSPLPLDELEFLAAKLEMLKVKDVALAFAHAKVNPAHEEAAAKLLREKGFRVFASHRFEGLSETDRWLAALECAYAESAICDEKEQIESVAGTDFELSFWTSAGARPWSEYDAAATRGGVKHALFTEHAREGAGFTLHCGLDALTLFGGDEVPERLGIVPTQLVRHGMWPFPHFADEAAGLEPGPMLFGKSHQLALLDVLYVLGHLKEIEGFTPLLSEKSRARIQETLFTLGKSHLPPNSGKRPPDALVIAEDLERAMIERLNACLAFAGATGKIRVTGPLAASLLPLLKERRPDLKFQAGSPYFAASACLSVFSKAQEASR